MKITDVFDRGRVKRQKNAPGPEQFRTAFKWGVKGGRMVSGRGATQEAADAACLEKIRERFRDSYKPLCLCFRGLIIIVWRNGNDWVYGHIHDRPEPVGISMFADWKSRDDVERAARRHLAEIGWDEQEETSEIIVHPDDQEWFGDWARKQKVFLAQWRRLLDVGWTKEEAVDILSGYQPDQNRVKVLGDPRQVLREMGA